MAITTYAELVSAIGGWLDRGTALSDRIPDFITLAELQISRTVRVWWLEKRATTTPTSAFVPLPTDYAGMRSIQWTYSDRSVFLEQMSPSGLDQKSPFTASGEPAYYAIHDGQIELRPAPATDNGNLLEVTYYYRPAALSALNTTNIYLEKAPDLLLFWSLVEAARYDQSDEGERRWAQRYAEALAGVLGEEERMSWPGELAMHVG